MIYVVYVYITYYWNIIIYIKVLIYAIYRFKTNTILYFIAFENIILTK